LEFAVENGESDMRLDYENGPKTYIAIGGTVLARGLTLEGLAVSFFLRTSNQYDTLLQMARWFGYRPDYDDLPRLWTTDDLVSKFRA
ncbi:Z1 domain-containing protein, partial [Brevibacterium sp. SIMBA_078]|uniref:Z1 domain-containing protein n=1 Tax=Brevibacterium sp. SIMBA_078 TaxID=3085816 RepID=UPI00397871EF